MEKISHIFYINLDHRTDRRHDTERQFKELNLNAERFSAVKMTPGEFGCALSHIKCLEMAFERGYENVLMVEDDMTWTVTREELDKRISNFFETIKEWDFVFFAYLANELEFSSKGICRAKQAATTTCYLVNRHYIPTLLKYYKSIFSIPMKNGIFPAIDTNWDHLLRNDKVFALVPTMGVQKDGDSDIRGKQKIELEFNKPFTVKLMGGLGNRMFQVAFGYVLQQKYGGRFFLMNENENKHSSIDYTNTLFHSIPKQIWKCNGSVIENDSDYSSFVFGCPIFEAKIYEFQGYFQNEKYFKPYEQDVIQLLTPKVDEQQTRAKYPFLDTSYFIHVRRGDFAKGSVWYLDLDSYYMRCLKLIESRQNAKCSFEKQHFYIFSDHPNHVLDRFSFLKNKTIVVENELDTLWLMSRCSKGAICGNSTFSWWGAYLNTNPDKKVYMPDKWLNNDWSCDIWPSFATKVSIKPEIDMIYTIGSIEKDLSPLCTNVIVKENHIDAHNHMNENGYTRALILESNLIYHNDWMVELKRFLQELDSKGEWDCLLLDTMGVITWEFGLRKAKDMYSSGGYVINRHVLKRLRGPIVNRIYQMQDTGNSHFILPLLVIQPKTNHFWWLEQNYMPQLKDLYS